MRVLVACERSGVVRDAFIAQGHDAVSCDLVPSSSPGPHVVGDVTRLLEQPWDLLIAHPPCTYLANSGIQHLKDPARWGLLDDGAEFFRKFLHAEHTPLRAIENPIPHRHAVQRIGRKYDQIVHPWQHGHMEQKATCLWLAGLPLLQPTHDVREAMMLLPIKQRQPLWWASPGPGRAEFRSRTYGGIASAMAKQWGRC